MKAKLLFTSIIVLFIITFTSFNGGIALAENSKAITSSPIKTSSTTDQGIDFESRYNSSIIISAAGDCTLGNNEASDFSGSFIDVFNKNNFDYNYFFKNVKAVFEKDDLSIVNLETTLTTATAKMTKEFTFKGNPDFPNILLAGNIEAVNISNNHIHDYFQKGFEDTVKNLKRYQVGFFGEGYSYSKTIKNVKIGFLGYRTWEKSSYMKSVIKRNIAKLKKEGNKIVIVSFHWGVEGKNYPNDIQREFGKVAIDNGADLVLGHHPHVMEGIEKYKGKFIVYSLGNFSFGGSRNPSDKDTFIFQQSFGITNGKLNLKNSARVIPCSISSIKTRNNYQPTPIYAKDKDRVIYRLNTYSKGFHTYIDKNGIIK